MRRLVCTDEAKQTYMKVETHTHTARDLLSAIVQSHYFQGSDARVRLSETAHA